MRLVLDYVIIYERLVFDPLGGRSTRRDTRCHNNGFAIDASRPALP